MNYSASAVCTSWSNIHVYTAWYHDGIRCWHSALLLAPSQLEQVKQWQTIIKTSQKSTHLQLLKLAFDVQNLHQDGFLCLYLNQLSDVEPIDDRQPLLKSLLHEIKVNPTSEKKTGLQISQVLVIRITQQIMLGRTKNIMKYHFFIECVSKAIADCCRLRLSPSSFTWSLLSAGAILWRVLLYMRWEQWHNGMRLWPTVLMFYDVLFQI